MGWEMGRSFKIDGRFDYYDETGLKHQVTKFMNADLE